MELQSTRRRFWRGCGVFGVGLTACTSRVLARPSQSGDEAVAAIRAVLERQQADWNKGDLDAFLTGYWNSPQVVFQSGGDRYDGWEAMCSAAQRDRASVGHCLRHAAGRAAAEGLVRPGDQRPGGTAVPGRVAGGGLGHRPGGHGHGRHLRRGREYRDHVVSAAAGEIVTPPRRPNRERPPGAELGRYAILLDQAGAFSGKGFAP